MKNSFSIETKAKLLAGARKSAEIQKQLRYQKTKDYENNPVKCLECNSILPYDKRSCKFCSRSCSVRQNNKLRKQIVSHDCPECGKSTENRNFCSKSCQGLFIRKNIYKHIETTGSFYGCSNEKAREYLILTRGHKCEICQQIDWLGKPIPLVRDHINGDSEDERLENNRMICCNCDAQTPTYKSKNIGKGRAYRRQRYAEGKSY